MLEFSLVEPDPAALRALVDLHVLRVLLSQVGSAPRAFVVVRVSLDLSSLGIQPGAHFPDYLQVLPGEILILVFAGLLVGRHCSLLL
ncbi:MAG TPA: hypothetical protein VE110_05140 [Gemmatimonadaceae bacterium]|nr:hypothetical protein [Gemmatimonadaceae bacterium]